MAMMPRRETTAGPYRSAADPSPTYRVATLERATGNTFASLAYGLLALVVRIAFWLAPVASFALWNFIHREGSAAEWFEDAVRWIFVLVTIFVMVALAGAREELEERARTARGTERTETCT